MRYSAGSPFFLFSVLILSGCYNGLRLQEIGDPPSLTRTQDPTAYEGYQKVEMPMPAPLPHIYQPNSLWRTGARTFFKDQRASRVGDIITVEIIANDNAAFTTSFNTNRESKNDIGITSLWKNKAPGTFLNSSSKPDTKGDAKVDRKENIKCTLAATVIQVLPNGNFVISGRQEMRINFEVRDVFLTGVIRPEDISSTNQISLEKIAEARISYGGRGQLSDLQQVPMAQQLVNQLAPF